MPKVNLSSVSLWVGAGVSGGLLALGFARIHGRNLAILAQSAVASADSLGVRGYAVLVVLQVVVAASGILPASLLGATAGGVYGIGIGIGFALAAASTMTGALVSFWIARSSLRHHAERVLARHVRLSNLDELLRTEGWRVVCLLRLSPVMPFAATSYALGVSSIGWCDYLLGTCAAMPALLGYVVIGSLARQGLMAGTSGAGVLDTAALVVGAVATLAVTLRLGQLARKVGLLGELDKSASLVSEQVRSP